MGHPFANGPQTSVVYFPDPGLNGQIVDIGFRDIVSGIGDTDLDVALGVVLGANGPNSVMLPGQASDVTNLFKGFVVYRPMIEPRNPRFAATDTVGVMRVGRIWILCQGDTEDEGPVYIVHSGPNAGKLRGDSTGATIVSRAKVHQGATAGNLAQVSINMP